MTIWLYRVVKKIWTLFENIPSHYVGIHEPWLVLPSVIAWSIWNFVLVSTHRRQIWGRLLSCLWLSTLNFWTPLQDIIDNQYPRKPNVFSYLKRKEHRAGLNKITENPFRFSSENFFGSQKQVFGSSIKAKITC